jgi:hypothetical protein
VSGPPRAVPRGASCSWSSATTETDAREEIMTTAEPGSWIELGKRSADGHEVLLLWNRSKNRVKVAVSDGWICHHLDFELVQPDMLSAFYEPFAHAAECLAPGANGEAIASGPIPRGERR